MAQAGRPAGGKDKRGRMAAGERALVLPVSSEARLSLEQLQVPTTFYPARPEGKKGGKGSHCNDSPRGDSRKAENLQHESFLSAHGAHRRPQL